MNKEAKTFFIVKAFTLIITITLASNANAQHVCNRCGGTGKIQEHCAYCKGYGEKYCSTCGGYGVRNCGFCNESGSMRCNYCGGRGTINNNTEYCPKCEGYRNVKCSNCYGKGKVECPNSDCHDGIVKCRQCNGSGLFSYFLAERRLPSFQSDPRCSRCILLLPLCRRNGSFL